MSPTRPLLPGQILTDLANAPPPSATFSDVSPPLQDEETILTPFTIYIPPRSPPAHDPDVPEDIAPPPPTAPPGQSPDAPIGPSDDEWDEYDHYRRKRRTPRRPTVSRRNSPPKTSAPKAAPSSEPAPLTFPKPDTAVQAATYSESRPPTPLPKTRPPTPIPKTPVLARTPMTMDDSLGVPPLVGVTPPLRIKKRTSPLTSPTRSANTSDASEAEQAPPQTPPSTHAILQSVAELSLVSETAKDYQRTGLSPQPQWSPPPPLPRMALGGLPPPPIRSNSAHSISPISPLYRDKPIRRTTSEEDLSAHQVASSRPTSEPFSPFESGIPSAPEPSSPLLADIVDMYSRESPTSVDEEPSGAAEKAHSSASSSVTQLGAAIDLKSSKARFATTSPSLFGSARELYRVPTPSPTSSPSPSQSACSVYMTPLSTPTSASKLKTTAVVDKDLPPSPSPGRFHSRAESTSSSGTSDSNSKYHSRTGSGGSSGNELIFPTRHTRKGSVGSATSASARPQKLKSPFRHSPPSQPAPTNSVKAAALLGIDAPEPSQSPLSLARLLKRRPQPTFEADDARYCLPGNSAPGRTVPTGYSGPRISNTAPEEVFVDNNGHRWKLQRVDDSDEEFEDIFKQEQADRERQRLPERLSPTSRSSEEQECTKPVIRLPEPSRSRDEAKGREASFRRSVSPPERIRQSQETGIKEMASMMRRSVPPPERPQAIQEVVHSHPFALAQPLPSRATSRRNISPRTEEVSRSASPFTTSSTASSLRSKVSMQSLSEEGMELLQTPEGQGRVMPRSASPLSRVSITTSTSSPGQYPSGKWDFLDGDNELKVPRPRPLPLGDEEKGVSFFDHDDDDEDPITPTPHNLGVMNRTRGYLKRSLRR